MKFAILHNFPNKKFLSNKNVTSKLYLSLLYIYNSWIKRDLRKSAWCFDSFYSFAMTYPIQSACLKIASSSRGCTYLFINTNRPGTSCLSLYIFFRFFDKHFSFIIWHKLTKFYYKAILVKRSSGLLLRHFMKSWNVRV